ncbi:thiol reductant ABC exporter subunit CydC [Arthrobacter sp. NPDC090010]|uniref:thiol reductant ABC exporter subunit CydC n=1 Tax=Arthrobacter sp. NPDC090010 TaxID=3363942 RepID=UPI0037FE31C0
MAERRSPFPPAPRAALYLLGLLGAVNALGLVLMAQAVASGIGGLAGNRGFDSSALLGLTMQGVVGAVLRGAASWGQAVTARATVVGVKESLRTRLLAALLGGRRPASSAGRGADALLVTRRLDELDKYYTEFLPALVNCATVPLLLGARILWADWISALIIVLTVPLIPLFMVLIGRHIQESLVKAYRALDVLSSHLVELVRGLPVLLGLGRTRAQRTALDAVGERHRAQSMATLRTAFLSGLALELIATISVALVAVTIGVRLVHGQMPLEAGLLALILAPECYQSLRALGSAYHASEDGKLALAEADALLASAQTPRPALRPAPHGAAGEDDGVLRLSGLRVDYRARGTAIGPLSVRLAPGRIVALGGPSGCGKSTLVAALTDTLDEQADAAGELLWTPGQAHPSATGRPRLAYAPQHPEFLHSTVEKELQAWLGQDSTPDRVSTALKLAGASELLHRDPSELSPGEQRRVAVARAFAACSTGAVALVLDEPTAHLDETHARSLRGSIRDMSRTMPVLLVSHDPLTLAMADETVILPAPAVRTGPAASLGTSDDRRAVPDAEPRVEHGTGTAAAPPPHTEAAPEAAIRTRTSISRGFRGRLGFAAVLSVLAQLFSVCLAALSGWLIVRASAQPPILYLMAAIVGVRFFGIGRAVLRYTERLRVHDVVFRLSTALRSSLWEALSTRALSIRRLMQGENALDTVVAQVDEYRDLLPRVLAPRWTALGTALAALVATVLVLPWATPVVALVCLLGAALAPALAVRADRQASRTVLAQKSALLRHVTSALQAWKDLRGNGMEEAVVRTSAGLSADMVASSRRSAWAEGAAQALTVLVCTLGAVAVVVLAALQGGGHDMAERTAVVALLLLALQEPFLAQLTAARLRPALKTVEEKLEDALSAEPVITAHGVRTQDLAASDSGVAFSGLSAAWPDGDPVFAGLAGAAHAGRSLAVTGESGSGKSTLLAVLMGFLPPRDGTVEIRGRIAWCPQESHVFDSTVRGNLTLAVDAGAEVSDQELWACLARVGLADAVREMPDGLATRIGPSGSFLSGGQRQRLAMARTLLAGANVLLLDEPTAHLDSEAADALLTDLTGSLRDETLLLVSHRAEDLAFLDQVLLLPSQGRVAQRV